MDFVFGSRLVFFLARIALFNLTAHELHKLLREALDRLCVRLNMYAYLVYYHYLSNVLTSELTNLHHCTSL